MPKENIWIIHLKYKLHECKNCYIKDLFIFPIELDKTYLSRKVSKIRTMQELKQNDDGDKIYVQGSKFFCCRLPAIFDPVRFNFNCIYDDWLLKGKVHLVLLKNNVPNQISFTEIGSVVARFKGERKNNWMFDMK